MSDLWRWLVLLAALFQAGFLVLEMFLWTHKLATDVSGFEGLMADKTKDLGRNMGLYNGFLSAGLFWSLCAPPPLGAKLALFFLSCMLIAGVFGGFTINRVNFKILGFQALPAFAALCALLTNVQARQALFS